MKKTVWVVTGTQNGFEVKVMIEATEANLKDYMGTELNWVENKYYHGATEEQVAAAKLLGLKIYMY